MKNRGGTMKKGILFSLFFISAIWVACQNQYSKKKAINNTVSTETDSELASGGALVVEISVDRDNKVIIPDPKKITNEVKIFLNKEPKDAAYWNECTEESKEKYLADLSFAGFKEDVLVTSSVIGSNNTIAIYVTEGITKETEYESNAGENYIVILDYDNKTYYKGKTDMFLHCIGNWNKIEFVELTGDNPNELVIQHCYNKSEDFAVFRMEEGTNNLIELYSTLSENGDEIGDDDREYFTGVLKDDYKVTLKYNSLDYAKTVSLLDSGFKVKDLEDNHESATVEEWNDDWEFLSLWKNEKLQKKKVDDNSVFLLYEIDKIKFRERKKGYHSNSSKKICLHQPSLIAHRNNAYLSGIQSEKGYFCAGKCKI